MSDTWDEEMMRLHHRIDELEAENHQLRAMLSDAIRICDAAIGEGEARTKALERLQLDLPLLFH